MKKVTTMKKVTIEDRYLQPANEMIEKLKEVKAKDKTLLGFWMAMRISGDRFTELRQAIVFVLTGKKLAKSKCGINYIQSLILQG